MPDENCAHKHAPDQNAEPELHGLHRRAAHRQFREEAEAEKHDPLNENDLELKPVAFERDIERIAQDVLGVALIDAKAVQLGILDDQPADMTPEEIHQGAVRIRLLVGMLMMAAVHRDPARRRIFHTANSDDHEHVLQPFRTAKAPMGEQAMIADIDAKQSAQAGRDDGDDHAGPAEIPGDEGEQRHQMVKQDGCRLSPLDPIQGDADGQRQAAG